MDKEYVEYGEVHKKIKEILNACAGDEHVFRGEKECYENISSGLYRYYCEPPKGKTKSLIDADDFSVAWEKDIIQRARQHFPDRSSDIEILTEIQHHGGKTTLIDFTRNMYMALFFACSGSFNKDGRVILFDTSKLIELKGARREEEERKEIDYTNTQDYILIPPTSKNTRVTSQNSVFVYSPKGVVEKDYVGKGKIITVEKHLKRDILAYLKKYLGIDSHTVYNDVYGFIQDGESYLVQDAELFAGFKSMKDKKPGNAVKHFTKYIGSVTGDKLFTPHLARSVVHSVQGNKHCAIKDIAIAIKIYPSDAFAHQTSGDIYKKAGELDKALADYKQALDLYKQSGSKEDEIKAIERKIQGVEKILKRKNDK